MLIDPCSQTKLQRDFESPLSFLASLQADTLKKLVVAAQIEYCQVDRLILSGNYGHNRNNSELRRIYWLRKNFSELMELARYRISAIADGLELPRSFPEPDTTYTMLDGLHKATLATIKRAMVMEIEPLRKRRQEDGLDAMSGLELLRFSVLNDHLVMVNDILLHRGYPFLSLTNCINDRGALDIDDSLFISE